MAAESISGAGTSTSQGHMSREEMVALFERRRAAYDDLNAALLAADYSEDCVVDSPLGGSHNGREAVQQVIQSFFDAFPDLSYDTEHLIIDGDEVAQVMTVEGTDIGGFLGLPATGKRFRVAASFFFVFKNRQIVHERRIYDFTGLLVQIGVLKAKPI
jgi:steroid delta-isomerase-like uncharacterized protein